MENPILLTSKGCGAVLPEYDYASLLFDPYLNLKPQVREELISFTYKKLEVKGIVANISEEVWRRTRFFPAVAQRMMQALGAYGRLVSVENRQEYIDYISPARENLVYALKHSGTSSYAGQKARSLVEIKRGRICAANSAGHRIKKVDIVHG